MWTNGQKPQQSEEEHEGNEDSFSITLPFSGQNRSRPMMANTNPCREHLIRSQTTLDQKCQRWSTECVHENPLVMKSLSTISPTPLTERGVRSAQRDAVFQALTV